MSWFPRLASIFAVCALAAPLIAPAADAATRVPLTHVRMSSKPKTTTSKAQPAAPTVTKAPLACAARAKTVTRLWRSARTHRLTMHRVTGAGHWVRTHPMVRTHPIVHARAACASTPTPTTAVKKTTNNPTTTSTASTAAAPANGGAPVPAGPLTIGINANTQGWRSNAGQLQDKVAQTGVRWLREELDWDTVETAPGQYDWTNYDDLYTAAAQRGMHVLPTIMETPGWAGATPTTIPSDPSAYADFVAHVVKRYGSGGDFWASHPALPATPSDTFELWNEPYWAQFSAGAPDAATYARLVAAAGAAAHAANPAAKVLIASDITGTTINGKFRSWTNQMYDAVPTLNQDFDGVAVHPYGATFTDRTDDPNGRFRLVMEDVRADFVAHGAAAKPFWLTEIGWSTCPARVSPYCYSEATQAAKITTLFGLLHTTYASYVRAVFIYHYTDQPNGAADDEESYFGLTRADGSHKPAYDAFQAAVANNAG